MAESPLNQTDRAYRSNQLRDILQRRIESGQYERGKKIDSVRSLAAEFQMGKATVQNVLRELEARRYICTVPGRGVFVNPDFEKEKKTVRLALVIPEGKSAPECMPPEDLGIVSGIQRGLLSGGEQFGAKVDFVHVPIDTGKKESSPQIKNLSKYDALVFISGQLNTLRTRMAQSMPVFCYGGKSSADGQYYTVSYNRFGAHTRLADHILQCGCKTVGIYSFSAPEKPEPGNPNLYLLRRAEMFRLACQKAGLIVRDEDVRQFTPGDTLQKELTKTLSGGHPDFIFCNNVYLVPEVYRACMKLRILIGEDIRLAGQGTGYTFQGIVPSLTYIKVPVFEAGLRLVELACEYVNGDGQLNMNGRNSLPVELELNESTSGCR